MPNLCAQPCPYRREIPLERRPANALCIEHFGGLARCVLKLPRHWKGMSAARWLMSGGSALVFGICMQPCPAAEQEDLVGAK
jgi:hypothetical protein